MSYAQQHNSVKVAFFVNFLKIVWTSKVSAYKNNLKEDYMKGKFGYDFFSSWCILIYKTVMDDG